MAGESKLTGIDSVGAVTKERTFHLHLSKPLVALVFFKRNFTDWSSDGRGMYKKNNEVWRWRKVRLQYYL